MTLLLEPTLAADQTDYRYYKVKQLPKTHRIVILKDVGFSLREIRESEDSSNDLQQRFGR